MIQSIKEIIESPMISGSEDFAYYLEKIPGCFFNIGAMPKGVENVYFNHHPKFDIDEDALLIAAKSVGQVVCSYFEIKQGKTEGRFLCNHTQELSSSI